MKQVIKRLMRLLCGEYSIYHIYSSPSASTEMLLPDLNGLRVSQVEQEQLAASGDNLIRDQLWYHGDECQAYACLEGTRIVGLCIFWYGERYRQRNFWPLAKGEAKLVQLVTLPEKRGQGIASTLTSYASSKMLTMGFSRLYGRIWHSNVASLRAFQRAGWIRAAVVIELDPLRRGKPMRIILRSACR